MAKYTISTISLLAASYVADAGPAYAYIDPGTASILLQGIVGGAATFLVVIRMYGTKVKRRILALFGRSPTKRNHSTSTVE